MNASLQMSGMIQWGDAAAAALSEGRWIGFLDTPAPIINNYRATRCDGSSFFFDHSTVFNVAMAFALRCAARDKKPLACLTNTTTGESHIL